MPRPSPHPPKLSAPGLADALADRFEPEVRDRGLGYFHEGRIGLAARATHAIRGYVIGTERYEVSLVLDLGGDFELACNCPAFASRGPCKHLWALILAADQRRATVESGAPLGANAAGFADSIYAVARGFIVRAGKPGAANRPASPSGTLPAAQAAPPAWRTRIEALRRSASAASPPARPRRESPVESELRERSQLIYVIDADAVRRTGQALIELFWRLKLPDGRWTEPRPYQASAGTGPVPMPLADTDRTVLATLRGATPNEGVRGSRFRSTQGLVAAGWEWRESSAYLIETGQHAVLLPLLCATGRFLWRKDGRLAEQGLAWDGGGPWTFALALRRDPEAGRCTLRGELRRGGERLDFAEPLFLHAQGWLITRDRAAAFDAAGAFPWIAGLRAHGPVEAPIEQEEELVHEALGAGAPALDLPPDWIRETIRPAPVLRLFLLQSDPFHGSDLLGCHLLFDYGGRTVAWDDSREAMVAPGRKLVLRDFHSEALSVRTLLDMDLHPDDWPVPAGHGYLEASDLPRIANALLADGWRLEAEGSVVRRPGATRLSVTSGIDWFELHGAVEFDGLWAPLPELLRAVREGRRWVRLGDGTLGMLPEEWLKKNAAVLDIAGTEGDHLRFEPSQAALLDALLAANPQSEAELDARFRDYRKRLRGVHGVEPAMEPHGFQGTLRPYQRLGLGWLRFLDDVGLGGCLADDMGLGKTVQVLAHLVNRAKVAGDGKSDRRPSLVVAPRSVVYNWIDEASRFAPGLKVLDYSGPDRRQALSELDGQDIVVTSYGVLRRDILALRERGFDYVVLDEAQAIKNANSQTAKAARLLQAGRRLALSGTPIENRLSELWSLLEFLNPGMLGRSTAFKALTSGGPDGSIDESGRTLLAAAIRPCVLRRTKSQVARDLPERTEQVIHCDLDRKQRKLYDELREHYRRTLGARVEQNGLARSKIHVLEALLRLRQAACHPALIDDRYAADLLAAGQGPRRGGPRRDSVPGAPRSCSAKLDALVPQLAEIAAEGHKALVFSQFTQFLALLKPELEREGLRYEYLDGRTRDRGAKVERFQTDDQCPLFLISLKAGGLGLNLTAADYVFLLDPWWNPAVEAQAIDRAHRIGQQRPVFAYRLICKDTVEEKILELQRAKRELADSIISTEDGFLASMTAEDLEVLLS